MATDGGIPIRYDTRGSAMAASEAASAQASGCGRSPCASRLAYEHRSKCSASHPSPTSCLGQRKCQIRRAGLARGMRQAALCHGALCNLGSTVTVSGVVAGAPRRPRHPLAAQARPSQQPSWPAVLPLLSAPPSGPFWRGCARDTPP